MLGSRIIPSGPNCCLPIPKAPKNRLWEDAFLDKEAPVSKPSKSSSSIVPFEKGIGVKSLDPPKNRNKGKGLASAIVDKQALIS